MNSTIGQILLWAGFLSGSLATVFATATYSRLGMTVTDQSFITIESVEKSKWQDVNILPGDRLSKVGDDSIATMDDVAREREFPFDLVVLRAAGDRIAEVTIPVSDPGDKTALNSSGIEFKVKNEVRVSKVRESGAAWTAGLRPDMVIAGVAERTPETAGDFNKAVGAVDESTIEVTVSREGKQDILDVNISNDWLTINWLWYALSVISCVIGIALLRSGKKEQAARSDRSEANLKQIKAHMADLVVNTERLHREISDYSPRQILTFIEETLADDLRGFADGRDSITAEHGLEVFARVMTQFSAGERAINRAWSASADGYVDEAASCVEHGLTMLQSAKKLLESA